MSVCAFAFVSLCVCERERDPGGLTQVDERVKRQYP